MKTWFAAALATLLFGLGPALAHEYKLGSLTIDHPWARATPGKVPNGAAYLSLSSEGTETDRLVAVATPVAKKAELHTHLMEDGVMKMRPMKAVEVTPGSPSVLKPGGHHIMLMGLKAPLVEGETFPLTLTFERAGSIEVIVEIDKIGATSPSEEKTTGHGHGS